MLVVWVGALCAYWFTDVGIVPFLVVSVVWVIIDRGTWASRPPDPGEFH